MQETIASGPGKSPLPEPPEPPAPAGSSGSLGSPLPPDPPDSAPLGAPAAAPAAPAPSDGDLARRAAAGDRQAAGALIDRHHTAVRLFLRRLTGRDDLADDLAQETFLRLLHNAHRYDPTYPMRRWLLTIARRLSINHARRADQRVQAAEVDQFRSRGLGPAETVARQDHAVALRKHLQTALRRLTESQRSALVLFHQQGLSVDEVARVMDLPAGTVKSHLHRGRAALREILTPAREVLQP